MRKGSEIKVLIVDDVAENIQVAMNILKEDSYTLSFANDGEQAIELTKREMFDLILMDVMMPKVNGMDACAEVKKNDTYRDVPIIFLTAKADVDSITKGFKQGAVDYIIKPFHADELLIRVKTHLELYLLKQELKKSNIELGNKAECERNRLISEIEENQREMIYVLMEMMESTSDETGQHIKRVAKYAQLFAKYTDFLDEEDETVIFHAAPMHDIGKIAIPKDILHKPARLTEEEFEVMKTHTTKATEFLKNSQRKMLKAASIIAHQHHEKWNGTGYPQGLKGEEIHIYGRIVALADVFDALTHKRQYKDEWSIDEAVEYIKEHEGTQFDPALVKIFIDHLPEFIVIAKGY